MPSSTDLGQAMLILAQIDGVTQRQLAAKARLSVTTISALARGRRPPAARTLEKLLEALGATQDELNRVMTVIDERRTSKQTVSSADSVAEAAAAEKFAADSARALKAWETRRRMTAEAGASYLDDDHAREIGRAVLRVFELIDLARARKASSP
jgi:transcriptional regulator with XRE-family HTH domain